jgi:hypothetical protein
MSNKYLVKIAEKKEESNWQVGKAIPAAMMGHVGGKAISMSGLYSGIKTMGAIDHPHSEADLGTIKKMIRDNKLDVSFNTRKHNIGKAYSDDSWIHEQHRASIPAHANPVFMPGFGKVQKGFIGGVKDKGFFNADKTVIKNKDVIMHELGHAKDFATHKNLKVGIHHASRLGGLASSLALTNKKTENYAVPIAAASTISTLRAEGMANYHAYKGIQAHKGTASANKFLKRLVPHQMGGYLGAAAGVVGGAVIAKKTLDYMNKPNETKD